MSLRFTENQGASPQFEALLEAFDGDRRVVVVTSREAIEDFGLEKVQAKASEYYALGRLDSAGRVHVLTSDL